VALRDIPTCFNVSYSKSFCVTGAILLRRFPVDDRIAFFLFMRSILLNSMVILCGRSTLDVSRCVFFANCIVGAARSGDKVQIAWQAWGIVRCDESWRTPRTKHQF